MKNSKSISKHFRFSQEDSEHLRNVSKALNCTEADIIRILLKSANSKVLRDLQREQAEERLHELDVKMRLDELNYALSNVSNNVNQIAKVLNVKSKLNENIEANKVINDMKKWLSEMKKIAKFESVNELISEVSEVSKVEEIREIEVVEEVLKNDDVKVQKNIEKVQDEMNKAIEDEMRKKERKEEKSKLQRYEEEMKKKHPGYKSSAELQNEIDEMLKNSL